MVGIVTVREELGDAEQREGAEAENQEGGRMALEALVCHDAPCP